MSRSRFLIVVAAAIGIVVAAVMVIRRDRPSGFRVGVIMPLTGGAASLGASCRNGVLLAVEEHNAAKQTAEPAITAIVEDDKADATTGVSAFLKLTSADGVGAIIGPLASGVTLAVAPLAERQKVVILSPGSSAPAISTAGDYVFRNELSEEYGAREQADLAHGRLGFKRVAVVYVNNEYGSGTAQIFRERFVELGGQIMLSQAFNPGTTDFRTVLTEIKTRSPDAVFFVYQDDITNFLRQRAELQVPVTVYTTPVFESPATLATLGALAEGVVYTYYGEFDPAAASGLTASFVKSYQERFSEAPSYYSAQGYDAARIMIEALRRCGFTRERLKDALYTIRDFPGVSGVTSFDSNGDVRKPVTLRTVREGRFVRY